MINHILLSSLDKFVISLFIYLPFNPLLHSTSIAFSGLANRHISSRSSNASVNFGLHFSFAVPLDGIVYHEPEKAQFFK